MMYSEAYIEHKLKEIVSTLGAPLMPTSQQLKNYTGSEDFYRSITRTGGVKVWADRLHLRRKEEGSICWKCRNAVPNLADGCSWSKHELPVKGWIAYFDESSRLKTWFVIACPEFMPDRKDGNPCNASINQFRNFALEIVRNSIEDYKTAYYAYMKKKEVYDLAIQKNKDHSQMMHYAEDLEKRYKMYTPHNELIRQFVCRMKDRIERNFKPYESDAMYGLQLKKTVYDCEKFFTSENFSFYSELNGGRVKNITRKRCLEKLEAEKEKARKKAEKERNDEDTSDEE